MTDNNVQHSLDVLFTMCFTIDGDLQVSNLTSALKSYFPEIKPGKTLLDLFEVQRPEFLHGKMILKEHLNSLFLLVAKDHSIALRGQVVQLAGDRVYRFVGSPWLAWMSEYKPQTSLKINDFPIFDSQLDQRFHVATQGIMVKDLQKLTGQLIQARDAADEANRMKTDLFAVMSHEMRTPLHGVVSALSLVGNSDDEAERKQLVDVAQKSALGLLNVINYALDYSKIEAGRMKLDCIEFGIMELTRSVADMTTGKAQEKGIELIINVSADVPRYFNGDQDKLRQVLVNLTSNALKFTDHGRVVVSIGIDETASLDLNAGHALIKFSVSDTGCGVPDKDLQNIFEPFWSKKDAANTEVGTGLGLKISKQLVTLMNADILVASQLDVGSVFSFTVALEIVSRPTVKTLRFDSKALPSTFSGRVMIVDDNLTNLMLTEMILKNFGLDVNAASSGQEAVDLARSIPFELILMDITMPGMDGIEAARQINQQMLKPPIVALTAHVQPEMIDDYLANGFKGYLRKPIEQMELVRELNLWLPAGKNTKPLAIEPSKLLVINYRTVDRLKDQIGETNFVRVRRLYLDETKRRLSSLLAAWVRRDHDSLALEAHTLASSVSIFGCDDLAWRMNKIDKASRAMNVSDVTSYMMDIEKHAKESLSEV
ncbi:MAG: signal transduction histidine kinase/CheY-like chemotaxis protein, partial [Candidatus Azotimanducaceae bacterium]